MLPPRHRFFRRMLLAALVMIGAVVLLRLGWSWWYERAMDRQDAAVSASGKPYTLKQFSLPLIPPEQNAWTLQSQAAAAVSTTVDCPSASTLEYIGYPPYTPNWHKLAAASEKANAPVFLALRPARLRPRGQLTSGEPSTDPRQWTGNLSPGRALANVIADGAVHAHLNLNNDAEAVERLRDILHLARTYQSENTLVAQLVGGGIDAVACDRAQQIAPGLRLRPAPGVPASEQQVRGLIGELLDVGHLIQQASRAHQFEFALMRATYTDRQARTAWLTFPLAQRTTLYTRDNMLLGAGAMHFGNLEDALAALPMRTRVERPDDLPRYSRWYGEHYDSRMAVTTFFRVIAERRLTAVSLAMQLYRAEHGKLPAKLKELVPRYLESLPLDPMRNDGRPIGLMVAKRHDGADRPLIYVDPPECFTDILPETPQSGWFQAQRDGRVARGESRQFRDVTRWVPPSPPEAVDDQPAKADAPGDETDPE